MGNYDNPSNSPKMKIAFYLALLAVTISSTAADSPAILSRKLMCAQTPGTKTNCCNDV
ncbi:hypothetical protein F441_18475, partial [Phytophthora nicotianae CJ01A1]